MMPTVDFTKEELLQELDGRIVQVVSSQITDLHGEIQHGFAKVRSEIKTVKEMLEEDQRAVGPD